MAAGVKSALKRLPVVGARLTPVRRALADRAAFRAQRSYTGAFLLNTMRKSGSHYLMSVLANYLWFSYLDGEERLDYPAMKTLIWNAGPVERLEAATGYSAWRWEHENPLIRFNNARTIAHTYRNPLDTFVSRYHYLYVNRDDRDVATAAEAIELEVPAYAWHYVAVRDIAARPNVRRIAYETLVREPEATVSSLLEFAGIAVDPALLGHAVEASSTGHVVADERRRGLEDGNLVGGAAASFIRSGAIGEWRSTLAPSEVQRIEEILAAAGITLAEFELE